MNEKQLRYIVAIADTGSIQNAARALGKSPSTLTRTLRRMEENFNLRLFRRTSEGLAVTSEGEAALAVIREIIARFDRLRGQGGGCDLTENEIRYLLAIRECGSISRAAAELFVAQPSLSQVLMNVESGFGQAIFKRSSEGVAPTAFGEVFLEELRQIAGLYRKLALEMEEFQEMKRGTITFGIPQNLGAYLLPMVLPAFAGRYPGIRIRFKENNSTELDRLLLADKTDFSIMHFQEENEALAYETFFEDPFYLVVPGTMRGQLGFAEGEVLKAEDLKALAQAPFVMVASRQKLREVADQILEKSGIRPDIRYVTKSMETAKRLVAAGLGVTFLPGSYLTLYSGMEGLSCYRLDGSLLASWQLVAAYPKKERLSRSAREFLRVLKECLGGE